MIFIKNIVILTVLLVNSTNLVNTAQIKCDLKNRPTLESCSDDQFTSFCAYYKVGCPFAICSTPASNPCYACADPNVLYYEQGGCKPSQEVFNCSSDICDSDLNPDAYNIDKYFTPTCGIKKSCTGSGDCDKTFTNVCKACAQKSNVYYQDGPCENDKTYCGNKRPTSCAGATKNVCASFTGADGEKHYTTVSNGCNACKDKSVEFYIAGTCGTPLSNNETYCLPNSRPSVCTKQYEPVCGFYKNSDGSVGHKIISNTCNACKDKTVIYTTPGPCVFYCDRNPFLVSDCAGSLEPICGSYKEKGVAKKVSLRNGCLGCYYVPMLIDSYTEGLCPGDNGILCKNNGGAFIEGQFSPVCGLTKLDCTNSSCRKSYPEPFTACGSSKVVKYIPGLCPGDIGISCDLYRSGQSDDSFVYENVCGFTKKACTNSSCRANYADQYKACRNSKVLYFNKGPC